MGYIVLIILVGLWVFAIGIKFINTRKRSEIKPKSRVKYYKEIKRLKQRVHSNSYHRQRIKGDVRRYN